VRIALVHDWLTGMRGGEKCLEVLCRRFPDARLFTLLHAAESTSPVIERMQITTSFLQRLPGATRHYRYLLPLMPAAVRRLPIPGDVDLVVSLSHAVAKSVNPPPGVPHVCYCFTPMRYAWHRRADYFVASARFNRTPLAAVRNLLLDRLRQWDRATSDRVTHFVAISRTVAARIAESYGRPSRIIYPPVDTRFYTPVGGVSDGDRVGRVSDGDRVGRVSDGDRVDRVSDGDRVGRVSDGDRVGRVSDGDRVGRVSDGDRVGNGRADGDRAGNDPGHGDRTTHGPPSPTESPPTKRFYYLCVSALVPYKRIDLAIEACNRLGRRLVVIGSGPERRRLARLAGPTVELAGWRSDEAIRDHLRRARALLFPGNEDFGIVPLEAQACGTPVVAFGRGGATETVLPADATGPGTGLFFDQQTPECLAEAIRRFEAHPDRFSPQRARQQAERFAVERFEREMVGYLEEVAGAPAGKS